MKYSLLIGGLLALPACISTAEVDRDRAYSQCRTMPGKAQRDECIAELIQKAERDRQMVTERQRRAEDTAEDRELSRVIAGVDQDDIN